MYGNLKEKAPPQWSDTIMKSDFMGEGTALLEKVCHCGGRLGSLTYVQAMPNVTDHFLLPEPKM